VRVLAVVAAVALVITQVAALLDDENPAPGVAGLPTLLADRAPPVGRAVDAYAGYGTWVDVYDYLPSSGSGPMPVTPETMDEMAEQGVRTLYLQTAQYDATGAALLADRNLIAQILVRAHMAGMQVVGWYLPRFVDVEGDVAHLTAISEFEVLGHRFDGVAVDIEWTNGVPDHAQRSERLVQLSEQLRDAVGDDPLGAIVLPPVQIEVINPRKWPNFPWRELAPFYDVWLPMSYWTVRSPESGYQDGLAYTGESVRRMRNNLDDPNAPVHAIGGIGDELTPQQADRFVDALTENDAIGGSIYDWATLDPAINSQLAEAVPPPDD
jgi:hypothetical protein